MNVTNVTTDTRAMTWHDGRVTFLRICAYLTSETKTDTVAFISRANAFVLRNVLHVTLSVRYDTRAKRQQNPVEGHLYNEELKDSKRFK